MYSPTSPIFLPLILLSLTSVCLKQFPEEQIAHRDNTDWSGQNTDLKNIFSKFPFLPLSLTSRIKLEDDKPMFVTVLSDMQFDASHGFHHIKKKVDIAEDTLYI